MKILSEKVLDKKKRLDLEKYKKKLNLGPGDTFTLTITQDTFNNYATNKVDVIPPPKVVDVMQIISLDQDDLKSLGIRDGWACVWGERI
jgi:hypothetical protein